MFGKKQPQVQKFIDLLGHRCRDRITGIEGTITHVGFDLYGCIQAIIHPGQAEPTKAAETLWMDLNRLEVFDDEKVMEPPTFQGTDPESIGVKLIGKKPAGNGPAEKPLTGKA
tara:strand:+ start:166 stop:504 length:339 start_codon:yes stop_codon:yes gene_type:complete